MSQVKEGAVDEPTGRDDSSRDDQSRNDNNIERSPETNEARELRIEIIRQEGRRVRALRMKVSRFLNSLNNRSPNRPQPVLASFRQNQSGCVRSDVLRKIEPIGWISRFRFGSNHLVSLIWYYAWTCSCFHTREKYKNHAFIKSPQSVRDSRADQFCNSLQTDVADVASLNMPTNLRNFLLFYVIIHFSAYSKNQSPVTLFRQLGQMNVFDPYVRPYHPDELFVLLKRPVCF